MTLRNQRISFADKSGALVFYVPLGEVRDIKFPWHLFGCGLTFVIGPNNYRISFARPGNTRAEADFGDVAQGRENCRAWKAALTS